MRDLHQVGVNRPYDNAIKSEKLYEDLKPECFVVLGNAVVGYHYESEKADEYTVFNGTAKAHICSYDFSDYNGGTAKVDRGHLEIVEKPDCDTNPYYDNSEFHSQAEYDDYIKWRD